MMKRSLRAISFALLGCASACSGADGPLRSEAVSTTSEALSMASSSSVVEAGILGTVSPSDAVAWTLNGTQQEPVVLTAYQGVSSSSPQIAEGDATSTYPVTAQPVGLVPWPLPATSALGSNWFPCRYDGFVKVAWTRNEGSGGQGQVVALATFDVGYGDHNCTTSPILQEGLALVWSNDGGVTWPSSNVMTVSEADAGCGGCTYKYSAIDLAVMPFADPVRKDGTHNFYVYSNVWTGGGNYNAQLSEYFVSTAGVVQPTQDYPNAGQAGAPITGHFPGNPDTVRIVGGRDTNGRDFLWSDWSTQPRQGGCATGTVTWYYSAVGNGGISWGSPVTLDSDAGFKECVNSQNQLNWTAVSNLFDTQDHTISMAFSKMTSRGLRAQVDRTGPINWGMLSVTPVYHSPDPCTPGPSGCTVRNDETDAILPVLAMSGAGATQHAALVYFDNRDDPTKSKLYGDVYGVTSTDDNTAHFPVPNPGSDTNVVPFQSVSIASTSQLQNIALTGYTQGPQFFGSAPGTSYLTNFSFAP